LAVKSDKLDFYEVIIVHTFERMALLYFSHPFQVVSTAPVRIANILFGGQRAPLKHVSVNEINEIPKCFEILLGKRLFELSLFDASQYGKLSCL